MDHGGGQIGGDRWLKSESSSEVGLVEVDPTDRVHLEGRFRMAYERVWLKDDDEFPGMNVGYVRVSAVTDDVADYVEAQKMAIQRFVEDRGGVVVCWYVDEDITGEGLDGPALQRMLTDAESGAGGFPRVFVWSLHRLSRNAPDVESVLCRLTDVGVALVSVDQRLVMQQG